MQLNTQFYVFNGMGEGYDTQIFKSFDFSKQSALMWKRQDEHGRVLITGLSYEIIRCIVEELPDTRFMTSVKEKSAIFFSSIVHDNTGVHIAQTMADIFPCWRSDMFYYRKPSSLDLSHPEEAVPCNSPPYHSRDSAVCAPLHSKEQQKKR